MASYTVESAIAALKTRDPSQVSDLLKYFETTIKTNSDLILSIASDHDFLEAVSETTTDFVSEELLTIHYKLIQSFFPIIPDKKKIEFVDTGFEFCLMEAINSTNKQFVMDTIEFITLIAKQSDYAIDSLFSFGIHTQLLDLAEKKMDTNITTSALKAVFYLFGEHENILSTILQSSLPRVSEMMLSASNEDKKLLLKTITEITNQRCSLCFILFESGAVPKIYQMLDDPDLVTSALPLIGNLCLSAREHVEQLIQMGLPTKLMELRKSKYASDAYWALSNLTEGAPDLVSNMIVNESNMSHLLESVLNDTNSETIELKKEATFFLATLIMFISRNFQHAFIKKGVFQALVSVLDVTNDVVVITRVFYVFIRFMAHIEQNMEKYDIFIQLVNESKLMEKVEKIEKLDEQMLLTKSHELMKQFKELQDLHDNQTH